MAQSPNILWIVTTQWRAQAFGFAGDINARTPNLDRLAGEGVNYAQTVTPHPFGPFARAAMLTGLPSPANGVADYFDPLPLATRTVAHDLAERGYHTAFFGKWHLGERDPRAALVGEVHARTLVPPGRRGGFEFWEGFESGFLINDPWLHGTRLPRPQPFMGYQSDVICGRASEYLMSSRSGGKFTRQFTVVSLEAPHPPYDAPSAGVCARDSQSISLRGNVPQGGDVEARARREMAGYYAHIEATDHAIGRLLASVDLAETLVVFTSVHGDMHGSHGLFRKGWPFEESVRVPLLVRVPGGLTSGDIIQDAFSLVDLRKMTCDWADGRSFALNIGYSSISMPTVVSLPHQCDRVWRGVRTRDRKLVLNNDGNPWLFFDLERDPFELNNLVADASQNAEIARLSAQIKMDDRGFEPQAPDER